MVEEFKLKTPRNLFFYGEYWIFSSLDIYKTRKFCVFITLLSSLLIVYAGDLLRLVLVICDFIRVSPTSLRNPEIAFWNLE